ncbi:MAG: hypothetical protein M3R44_04040, partial [Candidatus Eremiobacteraeota bacterium]|nr:hypothetical protein [Candidatus Eremiobacteraeota bacterium]
GADVLERYVDGVWLVELAPLRDLASIEGLLTSILGIASTAGGTARQAIVGALRGKQTLLIFDNCEHVVREAATLIEALLLASPGLRVLASSREALQVSGETVFRMPSLAVPPPHAVQSADDARCYGAIALFEQRAQSHAREFTLSDENAEVVAELCRRLDGIALAIELAAPRTKFLSPTALLERLDERFKLLTGGSRTALPRQQTMRALIDWSYDLLSETERHLFRRVAVFVGGWTLEGATRVCSDEQLAEWDVVETLGSLVEKSLVVVELSAQDQRYRMLESTRQYAREKLDAAAEATRFARAHAEWSAARMREFEQRYWSSPALPAVRAFAPELDNVRDALGWTLVQRNDPELGARIAAASHQLFSELGLRVECQRWLALAENGAPHGDAALRGRLAAAIARLGEFGSETESRRNAEHAVELLRSCGDPALSSALLLVALRLVRAGDNRRARELFDESIALARASGNRVMLIEALRSSALPASRGGGDAETATRSRAALDEALRLSRLTGDDIRAARVLAWLAEFTFAHDRHRSAALGCELISILRATRTANKSLLINALSNTAAYLVEDGALEEGLRQAREALELALSANLDEDGLLALFALAAALGHTLPESAARLAGFLDAQLATRDLAVDHTEDVMRDHLVACLGAALEPAALARLRAEGAEMATSEGFDLALAASSDARPYNVSV